MTTDSEENHKKSHKKEIAIALVSAIFAAGATLGADYVKANYLKLDDPLSDGVVELSKMSKELVLQRTSLVESVSNLSKKSPSQADIQIEINEIVNRVNNIVQTTVEFEAKSKDVAGLAVSMKSANSRANYNANADVAIKPGQAVSVCGNENTLGVDDKFGYIILNNNNQNGTVGAEYRFNSPTAGPSVVSFLGKNDQLCGTTAAPSPRNSG